VRFWDSASGSLQRAIIRSNAVGQSVNFSSDGKRLVVGDYENENLEVLSVGSGEKSATAEALFPKSEGTWACAFTPDDRQLVAVGAGFRVWNLSSTNTSAGLITGAQLSTNGYGRNVGNTRDLQIDSGGKWCVFTRRHFSLGPRPRVVVQPLAPPGPAAILPFPLGAGTVQSIGIVPGREEVAYVADGQNTRRLHFVNVATGKIVREMPLLIPGEQATTSISNFRFTPDSQRFAAASADGRRVNIYDTSSGRRLYSLPSDDAVIWWLAWHPDGKTLAVARENGDISVWNLAQVETALADVGLGLKETVGR
jgi:WD40 repeat protein